MVQFRTSRRLDPLHARLEPETFGSRKVCWLDAPWSLHSAFVVRTFNPDAHDHLTFLPPGALALVSQNLSSLCLAPH